MRDMPEPPEPLPISREIAEQMRGQWDGQVGAVEADAALIDSRVRPLVEALRAVTQCARALNGELDDRCGVPPYDPPDERIVAAEEALKNAGADPPAP